jgi:CRP-like cAMP-binding protein
MKDRQPHGNYFRGERLSMPATNLRQAPASHPRQLEDPLAYLNCSKILAYAKGQMIYEPAQPSAGIYLVIDGRVKVCWHSGGGRQVIVDIYQLDEFFGEAAFIGRPERNESAIALENTKLMIWTISEIEEIAARRPKLAIAILQLLVQRSVQFKSRIESFFRDNIERRLVRALIRFSERLGHDIGGGSVQMMPMTHEFLSQYVGTSREIVTHYMKQLQKQGYVRYSRTRITLRRDALQDWLRAADCGN